MGGGGTLATLRSSRQRLCLAERDSVFGDARIQSDFGSCRDFRPVHGSSQRLSFFVRVESLARLKVSISGTLTGRGGRMAGNVGKRDFTHRLFAGFQTGPLSNPSWRINICWTSARLHGRFCIRCKLESAGQDDSKTSLLQWPIAVNIPHIVQRPMSTTKERQVILCILLHHPSCPCS
jgi:hypothetical protein